MSNHDVIQDAAQLREHYGTPSESAVACMMDKLDQFHRQFISLSPLICMATSDREGQPFVSPKGDAPGFVEVLDDQTLLIPDRIGNNKVETYTNLMENPKIGLIFFVPGVRETVRVRGHAQLVRDTQTLERGRVGRSLPTAAVVVTVSKVYFHCGKAMIRSKFWDPERQADAASLPSFGSVIKQQLKMKQTAEQMDEYVEDAYTNELY